MIKVLLVLSLLGPLAVTVTAAPTAAAVAVTPSAGWADEPGIYTAPLDDAGESGNAAAPAGKRLSRARLRAFAWSRPGVGLAGAELYLDGQLVGESPLTLGGYLAPASGVTLSAQAAGCEEAARPGLVLPVNGGVDIALLPDDAAAAVTDPGWGLGLGLVVAGVLAYRATDPGPGLSLAGGGLLCAGLTQLWARYVTLPRLRARLEAYNDRPEPEPLP